MYALENLNLVISLSLLPAFTQSSQTELQLWCQNRLRSYYYKNACFVGSANKILYENAVKCNAFPNGHLAFLTTKGLVQKFTETVKSGNLPFDDGHFIGLYQVDTSDEPAGGWAWVTPSGEQYMVPKKGMIMWGANGEPNGGEVAVTHFNAFYDINGDGLTKKHALCQYDEPNYRQYKKFASDKKGHPDTLIKEVTRDHEVGCALECNKFLVCGSFSFSQSINNCLLHWLDGETQGYTPVGALGYEFWVFD